MLLRTCHSVIHYMQTLVLVRTCYCALATLLFITCNISFGAHAPMLSITYISLGARMLLRTCHSVIHYMQHQSWCAHATAHMPLSYFSSDTVEMSNSAYRRYCIEQWQCLRLKTDNQTFPHFLQYFRVNYCWFLKPILILSLLRLCIILLVHICIFFPVFPPILLLLPLVYTFHLIFLLTSIRVVK